MVLGRHQRGRGTNCAQVGMRCASSNDMMDGIKSWRTNGCAKSVLFPFALQQKNLILITLFLLVTRFASVEKDFRIDMGSSLHGGAILYVIHRQRNSISKRGGMQDILILLHRDRARCWYALRGKREDTQYYKIGCEITEIPRLKSIM